MKKLIGAIPADLMVMHFEVDDPDNPGEKKIEPAIFMMAMSPDGSTLCMRIDGATPVSPNAEEAQEIQTWINHLASRSKIALPGQMRGPSVSANSPIIMP